VGGVLALCAGIGVAAGQAAAAAPNIKSLAPGLGFESFSRAIVWKGDPAPSRIQASLLSARAELEFAGKIVMGLKAGLVLTDFEDLSFGSLPVGLRYDGPPLAGFALGADALAPVLEFSDFELSATGRLALALGMTKTWPLEDFAVDGEARGAASWFEIAAGPRLAFRSLGKIRPYAEIGLRMLWAGFRMTERLEDLGGTENKRVRGDFSISWALGADAVVSDRVSVQGQAGILPRSGGVDGLVSLGVLYRF
jgi:hypothetical protein